MITTNNSEKDILTESDKLKPKDEECKFDYFMDWPLLTMMEAAIYGDIEISSAR